ncbi:MAG: endonuclease III [Candidatus Pacearchaeota archaeon]
MNSSIAIHQLKELKKFASPKMRLAAEWDEKWKVLIATILSAQTRDEKTIEICEILFKKYPTLERFKNAKLNSIQKIIRSINYYKTKSKHILATAKIISKNGIPQTCDELLILPGVGRKVANVYLAEAHKSNAIGVDTHVGRISRKLGWTKNLNPHKVEKDLEKLFPKRYWRSINYIVVRFGRTYWSAGMKKKEDEIIEKMKKSHKNSPQTFINLI